MDFGVSLGGFVAGIVVGLTGMGGGALLMPILALGFGFQSWSRSRATSSQLP